MLQDFRNVVFLLIAICLMIGMALFATGEFDIFLEENPFATKPAERTQPTPSE